MRERGANVLVMIPYEIDIGFAIGRLVSAFYEMMLRLTGDPARIHFSFSAVGERRSASLPAGFANLLEFHPRSSVAEDLDRFRRYIREQRIDSIFGLDVPVNARFLPVARGEGVRHVISYWGAPMSSLNSGLRLLLKRAEVALHRARPDRFVFESQAMRSFAVQGRGVSARATRVVPTGVDADKFRPMPESASLVRDRFGIPPSRRIIVYMGHLHERKGVHVLMQAAGYLVRNMARTDVHCLFLGNRGSEVDGFKDHFAAAADFITFGGYQTDIPALLAGCYAGCIPSTGWDSFPMSSLEMQACGLPVLVSDWQGVPETVAADQTGVVVPVGDARALAKAIAELVDDPQRRNVMAQAARRRIEASYTLAHQIDNLTACAADLIGSRSSSELQR